MNIKRYFAPTAREALRRVKEELGGDAIVLSNRSMDDGVEITAVLDPDGRETDRKVAEVLARAEFWLDRVEQAALRT